MALIECPECKRQISDKANSCVGCGAPVIVVSDKQKRIIGNPIRIGLLEITQNDFPKKMNWEEARLACENLKFGWRLPTKDELNRIYLQKSTKKINLNSGNYWSSTEYYSSTAIHGFAGQAWIQASYSGKQDTDTKNNDNNVRAVREWKERGY